MRRTQLIIVRHGQTEWNLKLIRQGHLDSPLTETGLAQARALGERLALETFTALYSSDLGRAVQTAQMIAAADRAKRVLGWTAIDSDIEKIVSSAWAWYRRGLRGSKNA